MSLYVDIDVLNYGCGSISHIFGVLTYGNTHTHVNCNLECIRLLFTCMFIYQTVDSSLILRRNSTNGCVAWLSKFFHVKVVDLLWSLRSMTYVRVLAVLLQFKEKKYSFTFNLTLDYTKEIYNKIFNIIPFFGIIFITFIMITVLHLCLFGRSLSSFYSFCELWMADQTAKTLSSVE